MIISDSCQSVNVSLNVYDDHDPVISYITNSAFWLSQLVITAITLLVVLVHGGEACYSITVTVFIHTPFSATSFPPCVSMSLSHPLAFLLIVFLTLTLPLPSLSVFLLSSPSSPSLTSQKYTHSNTNIHIRCVVWWLSFML